MQQLFRWLASGIDFAHALLMLGVFSVLWGVVARGTPPPNRLR